MSLQSYGGATRLTNIEIEGQKRSEGFLSFLAEEQRKQAEKDARLMAPVTEALRALRAEQHAVWARPVADLKKLPQSWFADKTPDLGLPRIPQDVIDSFATDKRAAEDMTARIKSETGNFLNNLPARTGWVLSKDAQQRLQLFVQSQVIFQDAAVNQTSLGEMLSWLLDGECFGDSAGYDSALCTVTELEAEPQPELMDDVLRTVDINTQDGSRRLKRATDLEWMRGYAQVIHEFYNYLQDVYGISLRDEDAKFLFGPAGLFEQRGWCICATHLNAARRHAANTGRFVDSEGNPALTVQEVLDSRLAKGELDRPAYVRECMRFQRMNKLDRPVREVKGLYL